MAGPDLRSFVDRSRALVDSSPPSTARETRAWLVDPLLETLGWNVHTDAVATDVAVEDVRLEYVLGVDAVPAVFVAIEPYDAGLEEVRARALLEAMAWTGVDRAIYTNGREYALLAGTTEVDRLCCRLPELPDHASSVAHYSRAAATRRLDPDAETSVARRLALGRGSIVDAFVDQLTAIAGETYADEFETAADRFLDRLVVSFAEDESARYDTASEDVSLQFTDRTSSEDGDPAADTRVSNSSEPTGHGDHEPTQDYTEPDNDTDQADQVDGSDAETEPTTGQPRPDADATAEIPESEAERADAETAPGRESESESGADVEADHEDAEADDGGPEDTRADEDGEYVVRFFTDRGSVGAIGHSSSDEALVGVAEYLFERGLSGIQLPWSPDEDAGPTLINDEPIRDDGEPMAAPRELSNGLYLETAGDVGSHVERTEALASRAGFRVMLTGDWE